MRSAQHSVLSPVRLAFGLLVLTLVNVAVAEDSNDSSLAEAAAAAQAGDSKVAIRILDTVIADRPGEAIAYYLRGREHFRTGGIADSMQDFDKYVELQPERHSRLWERGITCYYAGRFEEGAKQFQLYQTYHSEDVENAAWHFLCLVRAKGFDHARKSLLTIRRDGRIPMMTVYDLFGGKASPKDVLEAAKRAGAEQRTRATFYAHLYLGLYFEAKDEPEQAKKYIQLAAKQRQVGGYMGDVAHVHHQRLKAEEPDQRE